MKALHIISIIAWFAGLFYLPRLFVYHSMPGTPEMSERFKVMERKLFSIIIKPASVLSVLSGITLIFMYGSDYFRINYWLHAKIFFVLILLVYQGFCWHWLRDFARDRNRRTHRFYRVANEIPTLLLIAIVILVVVKPF